MLNTRASHFQPVGVPQASRPGAMLARRFIQALAAAVLLASCGKEAAKPQAETKPAAKVETAQQTPVSDSHLDAEISSALVETARAEPEADSALADEAESILDRHPNKLPADLLNLPEVNASLKVALTRLAENKALQGQINSSVEVAAKMKGLSGAPGSVGLDLDTKNYNREQKSRMLQAVLSEDPKEIVNFLVGEIGEAAPELSYGGADRASNGVAIKENQPPAK